MTDTPKQRKRSRPKSTKRGRPTLLTPELSEEFCRRVATGRSVLSVTGDDDMPDHSTVYRWQASNEAFRDNLAFARSERAEFYSERMRELGESVLANKRMDPTRVRVAVEAIDKAARIVQPRRYEMSGPNGGPIKTQDLSRYTDDQLRALEAILSAVAEPDEDQGGAEE